MSNIKLKNSPGIRLLIIGFLTLVMLIPATIVQILIHEREQRREEAIKEVSEKWGQRQTISGPFLTVPYQKIIKDEKDRPVITTGYLYFLPDELNISATLDPTVRYRGIFEVILYNAQLDISGVFPAPDISGLTVNEKYVDWNNAFLSLGLSDLKGIKNMVTFHWNGDTFAVNPGVKTKDVVISGISTPVPLSSHLSEYSFSLHLDLRGSEDFMMTPVGKETRAEIFANWPSPSFSGQFLPEKRKISEDGFNAYWKVFHLNRNFPQKWQGAGYRIDDSAFGVNLMIPVDGYQKTLRTTKYAIMFIGFTFLAFFMMEILNRKKIHPIQYLLIGLALIVFYTLLLSFSEHILFKYAYLIASVSMILLISGYTKSVLSDNRLTGIIGGILILLYGYLYTILQLQDYALLIGSIGLFLVLAMVMYLTRQIDWFTVLKSDEE